MGRLANRRAAALPVLAATYGEADPALIYLAVIPPGPLSHGWGIPIATDTAFAIALIVLLGDRVPVELRIFLTAAVIVDDLVVIAVLALFYSGDLHAGYIAAAAAVSGGAAARQRQPGARRSSGTDHGPAGKAAPAHGPSRGIGRAGFRAGGFQVRWWPCLSSSRT